MLEVQHITEVNLFFPNEVGLLRKYFLQGMMKEKQYVSIFRKSMYTCTWTYLYAYVYVD
jgi:hypothetical protein